MRENTRQAEWLQSGFIEQLLSGSPPRHKRTRDSAMWLLLRARGSFTHTITGAFLQKKRSYFAAWETKVQCDTMVIYIQGGDSNSRTGFRDPAFKICISWHFLSNYYLHVFINGKCGGESYQKGKEHKKQETGRQVYNVKRVELKYLT